jgi:hypothetical protein
MLALIEMHEGGLVLYSLNLKNIFKMKTFFQFTIALFLLVSCNKEVDTTSQELNTYSSLNNSISTPYDGTAETRTAGNMVVNITTTAKSTVNVTASKVNVTYLCGDSFTVVANPGQVSQQTFTATAATITEPDTKLKLTKNPGVNQVIYNDKSTCTITANTTSQLIVNIQPGNINTNTVAIVGDEPDGF